MRARDVCAAIDKLAPPAYACDWDRPGLATGTPGQEVRGVLVALSVTRTVYERARRVKADMIVAHHPPIWKPLETLRADRPGTRLLLDIAASGMACYTAHTNLDMVPGGLNHVIAARLGLLNVRAYGPDRAARAKLVTFVPGDHLALVREALCAAGAGVIGDYRHCTFSTPGTGTFIPGAGADPFSGRKGVLNEVEEVRLEVLLDTARLPGVLAALRDAHPYEEPVYDVVPLSNGNASVGLGVRGELAKVCTLDAFARSVAESLSVEPVRVVGKAGRRVRSVAVVCGSGGGDVEQTPDGVDVYVTGDVKYHDALAAMERGLAVVDAGHVGTEKWVVPFLARYLRKELKDLDVSTCREPEPFRYVRK